MLKLPRSSLLSDEDARNLEEFLAQASRPLWAESEILVPHVPFSEELLQSVGFARRCGYLRGGLESIETVLQREEVGLRALREKSVRGNENVSRLLLMANDGSERFYRSCERLLNRHGRRLMGLCVDIPSSEMGRRFFGKGALVKAALVTKKALTVKVLLTLKGKIESEQLS